MYKKPQLTPEDVSLRSMFKNPIKKMKSGAKGLRDLPKFLFDRIRGKR